jgi:anti-sigma factor RsiW
MLTCKELTELVTDYLEGRMSFMERVSFHLHLGMCDRCRAYLRQMKLTVKTLGKLPDEPIPAGVRDELMVRFRSMRPVGSALAARRPSTVATLDGWLGSRGWLVVAVILFGSALFGVLRDGQAGPLFGNRETCLPMCVLMELVAALLPVVAVGVPAVRMRERVSAGTLSALATGGALVAYLSLLPVACPSSRVTPHVLVVHGGSILLAAFVGAAASRLPALRVMRG